MVEIVLELSEEILAIAVKLLLQLEELLLHLVVFSFIELFLFRIKPSDLELATQEGILFLPVNFCALVLHYLLIEERNHLLLVFQLQLHLLGVRLQHVVLLPLLFQVLSNNFQLMIRHVLLLHQLR